MTFTVSFLSSALSAINLIVMLSKNFQRMFPLVFLSLRLGQCLFPQGRRREINLQEEVDCFRDRAEEISANLSGLLAGEGKETWQKHFDRLTAAGVNEELASSVAGSNNMFSALSIIEGAEQTNRSAEDVAATYYQVGCNLDLEWFLEQLNVMSVQSHWQALARETYRDDLDWQQRTLTVSIINTLPDGDIEARMRVWLDQSEPMITRWRKTVSELREGDINDFAVFAVALRELLDLAQASRIASTC